MIKVMLIEDEPMIRTLLRKMIEQVDAFQVVSEVSGTIDAIKDFAAYRPQVVFVDVDLQGESGLDCAKMLTDLDPQIKIIFATAHSEYMANAFEIYAFDYLVKPFNKERLHQTLFRIQKIMEPEREESAPEKTEYKAEALVSISRPEQYKEKLMVKGKEQMTLVDMKDIVLIERLDHMTRIVTETESYRTGAALSELEEKLVPAGFMRCHKSYIINIDRITKIEPYGRWTYTLHFRGITDTALMTAKKYEELKQIFQ